MRLKLVENREVLERHSLEIGSKCVFNYPHTRRTIYDIIKDLTDNNISNEDLDLLKYPNGEIKRFSKEFPSYIMYSIEYKEEGNPLTGYLIVKKVALTCRWEMKIRTKRKKKEMRHE